MDNKNLPPKIVVASTPNGDNSWFKNAIMASGKANPMNIGDEDRRYMIIDEYGKIDPAAFDKVGAAALITSGTLGDLEEATRKAHKVIEEFGAGARVVAPYKPNRKQRRAQNKIRRSKEKK